MSQTPQQFKNRKAAHNYLETLGHVFPYRTFAAACAAGKCKVETGGKVILLSSLVDYINGHLAPATTATVDDAMARRKMTAETETAEQKNEALKIKNRENDKAWMQRADHEQQSAAALGMFQEAIKREIALKIDDIIHITGADQDRKPELAAILKEAIDDAGNVLAASSEFDVLFEEVGGDDE